ncbi:MAG: glutaminase A [Deltaproteobacteria bacterium]|nr:MAG: glutaminase A [Deltaproteobacteria bacterium]
MGARRGDERGFVRVTFAAAVIVALTALIACSPPQPAAHAYTAPAANAPASAARAASDGDLARLTAEAYAKFKDLRDGANADYIPELAKIPSELFGVAVVTVDGRVFTAGDVDYAFSIQSVSKPFTAALVMQEQGDEAIARKIGVEPTGMPFNSIMAIELGEARSRNPLVNAGAIAAVSMVKAKSAKAKYEKLLDWYGRFAGEKLKILPDIYKSEAATNNGNRGIGFILAKYDRIYADPLESVDVYTKQCSIGVTAKQLARMGATLANGGVNPVTHQRVVDEQHVPKLLAIMMMAGFYDESGAWAYDAGLPAKTGVGGGIVAIVPGEMAIVGFSPRLNKAGNSVRATAAIHYITTALHANVFVGHR